MASTFFVAPLSLALSLPLRLPAACRRRRLPAMAASPGQPRSSRPDPEPIPFGRFPEFTTPSQGDPATRDLLARELLSQAITLSASESFDSTIHTHLSATSDLLADMYSRTVRQIEERNEELTIRNTLPIMSKVNRHVLENKSMCEQQKLQISQELQQIHALLRQADRSNNRNRSSTRRRRRRPRSQPDEQQSSSSDFQLDASSHPLGLSKPSHLLFTVLLCALAFKTFHAVASRDHGAIRLAHYSMWSSAFILSCAYFDALRSATRKATDDLNRHTGIPSNRSRQDRS